MKGGSLSTHTKKHREKIERKETELGQVLCGRAPLPRGQNCGHAFDNSPLPLFVTTNPTTSSRCVGNLNESTNPSLSDVLSLLHDTSLLQSPASSTAPDQQALSCRFTLSELHLISHRCTTYGRTSSNSV
ncbi:hypothetical protein NL676_018871 [Syzygium grande]|nr:hypothetical protein NL676_018871 [Syzygium grande]